MNSARLFGVGEVRLEVVIKGPGRAPFFLTRGNGKVLYRNAQTT